MAPDTWKFIIPTIVIVKHILVAYSVDFLWDEIFHQVLHAISRQPVCPNHCLFKLYVCIMLCCVVNYFFDWISTLPISSGPVERHHHQLNSSYKPFFLNGHNVLEKVLNSIFWWIVWFSFHLCSRNIQI